MVKKALRKISRTLGIRHSLAQKAVPHAAAPSRAVKPLPYIKSFNVHGRKFDFFIGNDNGAEYYEYDSTEFEKIKEPGALLALVGENDNVLEIGSHQGFHTMLMSKTTKGKITAVEAFPFNAMVCAANVGLNQIPNCKVINAAGSDKSGEIVKITADSNSTVTVDGSDYIAVGSTIEVVTKTIDDIYKEMGSINVIKIDVEGFEEHVLRGATELLKTKPKIAIEIHIDRNANLLNYHGGSVKGILDLIDYKQYKGKIISKKNIQGIEDVDLENLPTEEDFNLFLEPK